MPKRSSRERTKDGGRGNEAEENEAPSDTKSSGLDPSEKNSEGKKPPKALLPGTIKSPGPNDVLLGRGSGANRFCGNEQFREIVKPRKEEYNAISRHKEKKRIAREIYDDILSLGGSFLRLKEYSGSEEDGGLVGAGIWEVVDEKTALEKCKMTLRQQTVPEKKKNESEKDTGKTGRETNSSSSSSSLGDSSDIMGMYVSRLPSTTLPLMTADAMRPAPLPSILPQNTGLQTTQLGTTQPLFFQGTMPSLRRPPMLATRQSLAFDPLLRQSNGNFDSYYASSLHLPERHLPIDARGSESVQTDQPSSAASRRSSPLVARGDPAASANANDVLDDEDAVLTLTSLTVAGRPKFTEQDSAKEMASLTNEERASVLSDMFGKQCSLGPRPDKRARRDLDADSISFLVNAMRSKLESIPNSEKRAFMEAMYKGNPDEFCDERLVKFLRVEGMNADLAAWRLVTYWETRRELFGDDKYLLPMTLSGAFQDDLVAIETGTFSLLPFPDVSGRPLLFMDPSRHTREGYSTDSMLRAFWYVLEVISQINTDVGGGFCLVVWVKNTRVSDFDLKLMDRMTHLESNCLPVNAVSNHLCALPLFVRKIIKPVIFAMMNKRQRSRSPMHDGTERECLEALSTYGILPSMLPTELGGTTLLNQKGWIANRRAIEMEREEI